MTSIVKIHIITIVFISLLCVLVLMVESAFCRVFCLRAVLHVIWSFFFTERCPEQHCSDQPTHQYLFDISIIISYYCCYLLCGLVRMVESAFCRVSCHWEHHSCDLFLLLLLRRALPWPTQRQWRLLPRSTMRVLWVCRRSGLPRLRKSPAMVSMCETAGAIQCLFLCVLDSEFCSMALFNGWLSMLTVACVNYSLCVEYYDGVWACHRSGMPRHRKWLA